MELKKYKIPPRVRNSKDSLPSIKYRQGTPRTNLVLAFPFIVYCVILKNCVVMKCNVTSFVKVERENEMPYFIIKATGVEGDESANVVDEDGCINPFAMMSRRFNFTKTLFPSTDKQVEQLEKLYEVDKEGKVVKGAPIRLMSVSWATGTEFYIRKEGSVTGVYETEEEVTEKVVRNGKTIEVTKTKYIPKVFKSVNLTLFENADGTCAENGGNADALCKRTFERGLESGAYIPCETATDITEVIV